MENIENSENKRLGHLLSRKMEEDHNKCLSENTLSEFIENKLSPAKKEKVFEHLNSCKECFEVYKITSSMIIDLKKKKKRDFIKTMSIAASLVFVFLIGFYYSSFFKPEIETKEIYSKRDLKSVYSLEETSKIPERSLSVTIKDEKDDLREEKIIGNVSREKKEAEKPAGIKRTKDEELKKKEKRKPEEDKGVNISGGRKINEKMSPNIMPAAIKTEQLSQEKGRRDAGKNRTVSGDFVDAIEDEEAVIRPKAPLKKMQTVQTVRASKSIMRRSSKKISNKKNYRSTFPILLEQGYVYKKINYFEKLTDEEIMKLLAGWVKLLPDLKGIQKDIAIETIRYLKKNKDK